MKKALALMLVVFTLFGTCFAGNAEVYDDRLTIIAMKGDASDFITVVEQALFEKGYLDEYEVDGVFDEYTELAVMNYQIYKGYEPTGALTKNEFYWLHRTYYNQWFDKSDIVWITASGTRYHTWDCVSIQKSYGVMPISVNIAEDLGYLPCRLCMYW